MGGESHLKEFAMEMEITLDSPEYQRLFDLDPKTIVSLNAMGLLTPIKELVVRICNGMDWAAIPEPARKALRIGYSETCYLFRLKHGSRGYGFSLSPQFSAHPSLKLDGELLSKDRQSFVRATIIGRSGNWGILNIHDGDLEQINQRQLALTGSA